MRTFLTALFCLGFVAAPTVASACMPLPDYRERWQEYEDQDLLRATVLFRGVIEDLQEPEVRYGDVTMMIRRTQSFTARWRTGKDRHSTRVFLELRARKPACRR